MSVKLEINFYGDTSHFSPMRVVFEHPLLDAPRVSTRGSSASKNSGSFPYSSACRALVLLMLKKALAASSKDTSDLGSVSGTRGSLAASLDYAISKQPRWLCDMFGTDGDGRVLLRRLVHRQNSERKFPGPVILSVSREVDLRFSLNSKKIDDAFTIQTMIDALERRSTRPILKAGRRAERFEHDESRVLPVFHALKVKGSEHKQGTIYDNVFDSFISPDNQYYHHNTGVVKEILSRSEGAKRCPPQGLSMVVDRLLEDLRENPSTKRKQFICTNTTTDTFGANSWLEDQTLRKLSTETKRILNRGSRFDIWRIFLLKDPKALTNSAALKDFYAAAMDNHSSGINVLLAPASAVCNSEFEYRLSDIYCVPEETCFVSSAGDYFLSRFNRQTFSDQKIIDHYSKLTTELIDAGSKRNKAHFWKGGDIRDFKALLRDLY